ncbi:XdhC family protein [Adhaeribacter pallidiroseus]|uniref:Putative xanthine dehydrogenase subunit n=1 Tax=Adhaeribacter pallidiroseus TaxID=2072847 RepID=A0A369QPI6_9BACT|nr:XdhC/CoxI family protein [Adhaeribacter pallidiroseus]RDC66300.1 putative xanthine dehydrogenase subunit [Adhaeribacter pallidiroseus]
MKEIQDIVRAYDVASQLKKRTALATVVQVEGSAYRRPGARMLVTEDGELTGAISGGCLEGDALRKARLVMAQQKALLVTYDTTDDDDSRLGVGLGCNGIIQILIEPIADENPDNPIALLRSVLSQRQQGVVVTLFSLQNRMGLQPGTCLLLPEKAAARGHVQPTALQELLAQEAMQVLKNQKSVIRNYQVQDKVISAFVEYLRPPVSVIVLGAGNDIQPLVQMASILGWLVTVIDGRTNYAVKNRFPLADKVLLAKPPQVLDLIPVDGQTVFLLMTHNYNFDIAMLRQLIPLAVPYVGVLGPKKKLTQMLTELQDEGLRFTPDQMQKVYGPLGLDIGAETPEEIALSVLSEIKAVLTGKPGTALRNKPEAIHDRTIIETPIPVTAAQPVPDAVA